MSYVVVGGGIAGVCCAQTLLTQRTNKAIDVVLITPSSMVKSAGTLRQVSQVLTDFEVEEKSVNDFALNFPGITIIQDQAVCIQEEENCVVLQSGKNVSFIKLAVCTGAQPDLISSNNEYVLGIRDTETVEQFTKKLQSAERIVIIGNGGIAMELVFKIKNCDVIWAIRDSSIGTTFLDPGGAEFLVNDFFSEDSTHMESLRETDFRRFKYTVHDLGSNTKTSHSATDFGSALGPDWHENVLLKGNKNSEKKINIVYNSTVTKISSQNEKNYLKSDHQDKSLRSNGSRWPVYVALSNGEDFGCDFVVSATGVLPNVNILKSLPNISIGNTGVNVDSNFRVIGGNNKLYAAGDVCCCNWNTSDQWQQQKLWSQARQMGIFCGLSMISHQEKSEDLLPDICFDLFSHVTKFFGHKVVLLGKYNGQDLDVAKCEIVVRVTPKHEYIKLVLFEGKLYGAVLIGETELEETFENLILNRMDLSVFGEDLLHPDLDLADYFD